MQAVRSSGDGDRLSKGGNFLNGSGNDNPVKIQRNKATDKKVIDIIRGIRTPSINDQDLLLDIETAFKKRPSLAEKMFKIKGTNNSMTLGEIALDFNRPVLAQQINNIREGLVYKRQAQEARIRDLHKD